MTNREGICIDSEGNRDPLSQDQLNQITSYLRDINNTLSSEDMTKKCTDLDPKPEQVSDFFQLLDNCYWSEKQMDGDATDIAPKRRPAMLNLCSRNGTLAVTAAHFNLCSHAVGLDVDQTNIKCSMKLSFEQKVFEKCSFFETDFNVDPKLLLDNPHFMADKINEADVVFMYVLPDMIQKLIPFLSLPSSKQKEGRKFVTLVHHIPEPYAVRPQVISGTELCVYDGIADNGIDAVGYTSPNPPEPVDGDEIDKDFARSSIRHALPRRF